jgi:serpin B
MANQLRDFGRLAVDGSGALFSRADNYRVELRMPRFHLSSYLSLRDALNGLGVVKAFQQSKADFSGITNRLGIFLGDVVQGSLVKVDELGTEAAAVTLGPMILGIPPPRFVRLSIDRPFAFVIRENKTGMVCFAGRVTDPSK